MRKRIWTTTRGRKTIALTSLLIIIGIMPIDQSVTVPAVLSSIKEEPLYLPEPAQLKGVFVREGMQVKKGQELFEFASHNLIHEINQSRTRLALYRARLKRQASNDEDRAQRMIVERELVAEQELLHGLEKRKAELSVRAPFDGKVVDLDKTLAAGQWVSASHKLVMVAGNEGQDVRGYIAESDIERVEPGAWGTFVMDAPFKENVDVQVRTIAQVATNNLDIEYLASTYEGAIAVTADQEQELATKQGQFKVILSPLNATFYPAVMRGSVELDGEGRSFFGKTYKQVMKVLVREQGL